MQKITPCLWFDNNGEEAMNFYMSVFDHGQVKISSRWPEGGPGPAGTLLTAIFEMFGQDFMVLNGGPNKGFNEAISFTINCDTQEEIDAFWNKLSAVPEAEICGWLKDKYGVSWQITPKRVQEMVSDPDAAKVKRVLDAIRTMKKIDLATLETAYAGA